jgi:hypothetical protein
MLFEPLFRLPAAWSSVSDRFGVHLFEGELTVADMDQIATVAARWHALHPGKVVELSIIHPSASRLSLEQRSRLARLIKRWESERTAAATVVLAGGLTGAVQRSLLTGLLMVVRPPHPTQVFASTGEALEWLLPHVRALSGRHVTLEALRAGVDRLCHEFGARRRA